MWSRESGQQTFILVCLALCLFLARLTHSFDIRSCNAPLGMESGAISDDAITASSSYVPNVGPKNGRLRVERAGGGWCPKLQVERGIREYIEVDLGQVRLVTGVQTQGRYDRGRGQEYAEEYTLEYWRAGLTSNWTEYKRWDGKQILRGNSDTASVESHRLMPAVFASKIRILPYSIHRRTVCLRMELLGCLYDGGVASYSCPEGSDLNLGLCDSSYDGSRSPDGWLQGGLGRLVDGEIGADNYRLDIGYAKGTILNVFDDIGNGWVGWKNGSLKTEYVELAFEFDQVRNFSYVHLYTNNFFSRNVRVFSKAKVLFSLGGRVYNSRTLSYTYMPDEVLENGRNVSINLHQRIARFVQLKLYFADEWILLGEAVFDSVLAFNVNATEEDDILEDEQELIVTPDGNNHSAANSFDTIAAKKNGDGHVEVVIGVLTAIMLLLLIAFVVILVLSRRHKLQGSPTLLRNPFGVTINMKGLLKNLSGNNNGSATMVNGRPTSLSPGQPLTAVPISISFEQYQPPLINGYYPPNYTTLRVEQTSEPSPKQSQHPPEVPPLPSTPSPHLSIHSQPSPLPTTPLNNDQQYYTSLNNQTNISNGNGHLSMNGCMNQVGMGSPMQYRSLQTTPALSPKSKHQSGTMGTYLPVRVANTDPPNRKRYHTAPRDKQQRALPPIVAWNIAPSVGHSYTCREVDPTPMDRYTLTLVENLGSCLTGELSLYENDNSPSTKPPGSLSKLVLIRTTHTDQESSDNHSDSTPTSHPPVDYLREIRMLSSLIDTNVCQILGYCYGDEESPKLWTVLEYGEMGDLNQYLQFLANRNGTVRSSQDSPISVETLLYMSTQIASGMKYLESKHIVHKDLATRNCLVGRGYIVKITDIAMCKPQYKKDYMEIGGRNPAPIRWLPWESILLDRYTCSSSVWSFAVTVWEILSFACEKPYQSMSNDLVVQNAEHMYYGGDLKVILEKPTICPDEIYDLLCQCWKRDDSCRPNFKQIYLFLKHNNNDYIPSD